jgi:hypothetical protein
MTLLKGVSKRLVHGGYQSRPEIKLRKRKGKPPQFPAPDNFKVRPSSEFKEKN